MKWQIVSSFVKVRVVGSLLNCEQFCFQKKKKNGSRSFLCLLHILDLYIMMIVIMIIIGCFFCYGFIIVIRDNLWVSSINFFFQRIQPSECHHHHHHHHATQRAGDKWTCFFFSVKPLTLLTEYYFHFYLINGIWLVV